MLARGGKPDEVLSGFMAKLDHSRDARPAREWVDVAETLFRAG